MKKLLLILFAIAFVETSEAIFFPEIDAASDKVVKKFEQLNKSKIGPLLKECDRLYALPIRNVLEESTQDELMMCACLGQAVTEYIKAHLDLKVSDEFLALAKMKKIVDEYKEKETKE